MPLSVQGLCEAEITTPASYFRERARYASPGVVRTPALCTSQPQEASPSVTRSAIHELDSRGSWPTTTLARGLPRIKSCPSARPIRYVLSAVSGNSPATPRIPSVPKSCRLAEFIAGCGLVPIGCGSLFHDNRNMHQARIGNLNQRIGNVSMAHEGCA